MEVDTTGQLTHEVFLLATDEDLASSWRHIISTQLKSRFLGDPSELQPYLENVAKEKFIDCAAALRTDLEWDRARRFNAVKQELALAKLGLDRATERVENRATIVQIKGQLAAAQHTLTSNRAKSPLPKPKSLTQVPHKQRWKMSCRRMEKQEGTLN